MVCCVLFLSKAQNIRGDFGLLEGRTVWAHGNVILQTRWLNVFFQNAIWSFQHVNLHWVHTASLCPSKQKVEISQLESRSQNSDTRILCFQCFFHQGWWHILAGKRFLWLQRNAWWKARRMVLQRHGQCTLVTGSIETFFLKRHSSFRFDSVWGCFQLIRHSLRQPIDCYRWCCFLRRLYRSNASTRDVMTAQNDR